MPLSEEIYLAGGCLWGVQEFVRHLPGVLDTQAGRANGTSQSLDNEYDGYAECVRTTFDPDQVKVTELIEYFFEIIDPHSLNKQGPDIGDQYRSIVFYYNDDQKKIAEKSKAYIQENYKNLIVTEIISFEKFYLAEEYHQDYIQKSK